MAENRERIRARAMGIHHAALTLIEVAEIMTARGHSMSWQAVQQTEVRALAKLRLLLEREYGEDCKA